MMTLSPHVYYDIHIVIYANSGVGYQLVCNLLVLQGNYYDLQGGPKSKPLPNHQ